MDELSVAKKDPTSSSRHLDQKSQVPEILLVP